MRARSVSTKRSLATDLLTTPTRCAQLIVVGMRAAITIVSSVLGDLVGSAPLVLGSHFGTLAVKTPCSSTIHRLRATASDALLVVVRVWAAITIVSSVGAVLAVPAPVVLMVRTLVVAGSIRTPSSSAVHGLRATTGCALLVVVAVWAAITIVGRVRSHLLVLASLVLVIRIIVVARSVSTPRANTVHWLRATAAHSALLVVVGVRAPVSIVGRVRRYRVVPASLVLVGYAVVVARTVSTPRTSTVLWLRASRRGALLVVVVVRASNTTMGGIRRNLVVPAYLVLVVRAIMITRSVSTPRANAVHRLRASRRGVLLVVVGMGATVTVVSSILGVLVLSAALVLVAAGFVARSVSSPRTNTIHRLSTTRGGALLVVVAVWAAGSAIGLICGDTVVPAPLVLVVRAIMVTRSVTTPSANTVQRLRASAGCALLVFVGVRAIVTVGCPALGNRVLSATLVLVAAGFVARSVSSP